MDRELESLYRQARDALKARDYDRASELLRQILLIDENYKDASRLLAQAVKLKRRRWYSHPLLWGALGFVIVVALGFLITSRMKDFAVDSPTQAVATSSSMVTLAPTMSVSPTESLLPTATPIPLTWKRISLGQEFERGTVTALVMDSKDPEVLYVGMENAGIYKSIDGGLSWHPAHHGLANAHVTSLLIDFQNPQTLYAVTVDRIYKTEDGGENWYKFAEEVHLLMDPQDSSHLYKRDSSTISESTDQGRSWQVVYSSNDGCPGEILGWDIHPVDGNTLFVGGGEFCEPGVYISSNGGRSWMLFARINIREGGYTIYDMGLESPDIGLDEQGTLYFHLGPSSSSSDRGVKHMQSGMWRTILDLDYHVPVAVFDSLGSVYFYCDTHLCKFNLEERKKMTLGNPDVGEFTVIAASPSNPNTVYVGGEGLAVSKDEGMTWTKLTNGLGSTFLSLEAGRGNDKLYALSGNCIQTRIQLEGFYGNSQEEIVQSLYISTNKGNSWDFSIRYGCYVIRDADGVTLYRYSSGVEYARLGQPFYASSFIWRSRNGGASWETVNVPSQPTTVTADISQSGLLYIYLNYDRGEGVNYHEYISEDFGENWRANDPEVAAKPCYGSTLQFMNAYHPTAIDPFDGNHVFVIDSGILLESHDGCETTNDFAMSPSQSMNSIAFDSQSPNTLYAGTDEGAYVSFDGGQTWHQINDGLLGATVVYSIVVDEGGNVYAATPYGIFRLEESD